MKYRLRVPGLTLTAALLAAGCGLAPEEPDVTGEARGAIRGGEIDDADRAVVGILALFEGVGRAVCTGSLIAPNVVLTARHCVARLENDVNGGVVCDATTFAAPEPSSRFFVTTDTEMTDDPARYRRVREVMVPPGDPHVCGNDQAILILDHLVPPEEATPLVPRVDEPLAAGEASYRAVGYGATDDPGAGSGTRRRRDDLVITCVAEECPAWRVMPTEWQGDQGICQGDSGGPSLDRLDRVIGVTSRGTSGCDGPVYDYVYARAAWIKDAALRGAELGGYEPPAWAHGAPTDPGCAACPDGSLCEGEPSACVDPSALEADAGVDVNDGDPGGAQCSTGLSSPHPTTPIPWLAGAGIGLAALIRRRRTR